MAVVYNAKIAAALRRDCHIPVSQPLQNCTTLTMKFLSVLAGFAAVAIATPTPTNDDSAAPVLDKRASVTEVANLGYATQNGG